MFNRIRLFSLIIAALLLGPGHLFAQISPNQRVSVTVRNAKLRQVSSHWSAVVADLAYGSTVTFITEKGEWAEVETESKMRGFMHVSALTTRRIVLTTGAYTEDQGAVATDVVLAGKGFNSDVEDLYQEQVADLPMTLVNDWEKEIVSDQDLATFMRGGELTQ